MGLLDGIPSLQVLSSTFSGATFQGTTINSTTVSGTSMLITGSTVASRVGLLSSALIGSPASINAMALIQAGSGATGAGSVGIVTFNTNYSNTQYAFNATARQSGVSMGYNAGSLNVSGTVVYSSVASQVFDWNAIGY